MGVNETLGRPTEVGVSRNARGQLAEFSGHVLWQVVGIAVGAIGYAVQRYKMVSVMLSGLFAGLAGVLYAVQKEFAAPDFVYFLVSGETVIYNVMGGIGTLVGPIVGAAFFLMLRETFSRFFTEHYLIPVGIIFIVMVIFTPQGLLGFARRWLNK